ncbi:MAG: polysaccharide pyruvyl transferase family protein [Anaerolineales bacterium]
MQILIENGTNQLDNLGDIAMLRVTVERLRNLWPEARLSVVTRKAAALERHLPNTSPVLVNYPKWLDWLRSASPAGGFGRGSAQVSWMKAWLVRHLLGDYRQVFAQAVGQSDMIVHAGSGIFADPFLPAAIRHLVPFEYALRQGKPTAFFAQGIGPLNDPILSGSVVSILSQATLVTTRDRQSARLLAEKLRVPSSDIDVTGDDALDLAYRNRQKARGPYVGVNLRFAYYSGLSRSQGPGLEPIKDALDAACTSTDSPIMPFAIHHSDIEATSGWLSRSGLHSEIQQHEMTVFGLLQAISRCRIVVTASYHGAVLALGQGIPAVCLFTSGYYRAKFTGLAEMFSQGCLLVDLNEPLDSEAISNQLDLLLEHADELRAGLLETTATLVRRSEASYAQLRELT